MPKILLSKPILNEKNEPMMDVVRDKVKVKFNPATGGVEGIPVINAEGYVVMQEILLSDVIINVLMDNYEGDMAVPGADRLRRHILAQRIQMAGTDPVDLDSDEITMIRELTAKKRPTLVVGRVHEATKIE